MARDSRRQQGIIRHNRRPKEINRRSDRHSKTLKRFLSFQLSVHGSGGKGIIRTSTTIQPFFLAWAGQPRRAAPSSGNVLCDMLISFGHNESECLGPPWILVKALYERRNMSSSQVPQLHACSTAEWPDWHSTSHIFLQQPSNHRLDSKATCSRTHDVDNTPRCRRCA